MQIKFPNIFLMMMVVLFLGFGCQSKTDDAVTKTGKKAVKSTNSAKKSIQKKKNIQKKGTQANKTSPNAKLVKSTKPTKAGIRVVNDKAVAKQKQPIVVTEKGLKLSGFAVDAPNKTVAKQVYIVVGEKEFKVNKYGIAKQALAKSLGKEYLKSGFAVTIPKAKLPKGNHDVKVKVIASKGNTYYTVNSGVKITNK